jgi:hypothetical protein
VAPPELPCAAPELPWARRWELKSWGHAAPSELPYAGRRVVEPAPKLPRAGRRARTHDAPKLPRAGRWAPEQWSHAAASELPRASLLLVVSGDFFLVTSYCPIKNSRVLKNIAILQHSRRCRWSYVLTVVMVSSSTSSGHIPVL